MYNIKLTLPLQLSYPNQQLKPIQEGSEISSLQSVTHHGMIETDENRHRLLQQQLGILLHAHRCLKLGTGGDCKVPMCSTMKDVLKHMTVCETKENCYCKFEIIILGSI
ncbi:hypothetical protein LOD99_10927 [Oopsacas minuta]|uniref:histone acetyltransferase n=1 Tax=Oopsacas minuta TaxID=111878 RepID=A0AAV7KET3_9METZ|nr:hypothetical protein LOD99_10927 [Oopsacas minuta]